MRDGKVSVEMLTESQEAKRLLEHQLSDLKSQLISNHLQVDKLQVETQSNMSRQNEQQQSDAHRQAARGQEWSQFNGQAGQGGQHQARRQAYDAPAGRAYGIAGARGVATTSPMAAAAAQARGANSRRLNLVA